MGTITTISASSETSYGPSCARSSYGSKRHLVGAKDRGSLAGSTRAVWKMDDDLQPVSALAESWDMGSHLERRAGAGGSRREGGLGDPLCRLNHRAGPSACCRGKKSDPETEALGRSRGGFSTKLHVRAEGMGKLITFLLTPGQRHDITVAEQLMEQGAIRRLKGGRPRLRPKRISGDKGYNSRRFRMYLRRRGIRNTIPRKDNERRRGPFDRQLYRLRNQVERLINRMKQFRRIATRYEKRAVNYAAMVTVAAIYLWL